MRLVFTQKFIEILDHRNNQFISVDIKVPLQRICRENIQYLNSPSHKSRAILWPSRLTRFVSCLLLTVASSYEYWSELLVVCQIQWLRRRLDACHCSNLSGYSHDSGQTSRRCSSLRQEFMVYSSLDWTDSFCASVQLISFAAMTKAIYIRIYLE